jgi:nucleoside-diphosphate kinase
MQKTFVILKPDCMDQKHVGQVLARFEAAGFKIIACKLARLSQDVLRQHYAHVADRPFYPTLESFMMSAPVLQLALAGDDVIAKVRAMLGPTDSRKAEKGTIRGDYGTDTTVNVAHASDGEESARAELARFFRPEEILG